MAVRLALKIGSSLAKCVLASEEKNIRRFDKLEGFLWLKIGVQTSKKCGSVTFVRMGSVNVYGRATRGD